MNGNKILPLLSDYGRINVENAREIYEKAMKEAVLERYTFPTKATSDGYFHIYVTDPTKKSGRRAIKAKTIEELKDKVYRYEKGLFGTTRKTFSEVFELLTELKLNRVKDPEKRVSRRNTVGRMKSEYIRFFAETPFERLYIDEITRKDINAVIYDSLQKYDLRKKAVSSLCSIIKQVFELAESKSWILRNPYPHVDFEDFRDMLLAEVPIIDRAHTQEELGKMLQFVHAKQQTNPSYLAPYAFELQMIIGCRRGEIPPLAWKDIQNNMLLIYQEQLTWKRNGGVEKESFLIVRHTKTGQSRGFPITEELAEYLQRLRAMHDRYYPHSHYLFPADTPNGVITNNVVYNFYRRMCRKLGISISKQAIKGTHSLRRNAITDTLIASNGDIELAASLYGNSPEVIRNHYNLGADIQRKREVLEKCAEIRKARESFTFEKNEAVTVW